jgi:predicted dehydrogenase
MSKQVKLALIGAGNRGQGIFGQYALDMPHRARFTAVVEPDKDKREFFSASHEVPAERSFDSLEAFMASGINDIDGVVIATLEDLRIEPVFKAMERNWHILVEKPLCTSKEELIKLYDATRDYENILIVCHQMRLTPVYKTIKELIDSGKYGDIVSIQHSENVCWHHMAHSFVRGLFNNDRLTPMLLAKSCHDMDLLTYLIGKKAVKVSSFGSLKYFTRENCPEGAPQYCLEGCPHYQTCPYDVSKIYFDEDTDPAYIRQMGVVKSKEHLRELMLKNRFGKCVFQSDNNVVDNQTVQIEFEDNITVSFTMCAHNAKERRMTKISMTNGEIEYNGMGHYIKAGSFEPRRDETIDLVIKGTHGGGDRAIMDNFVDAIVSGDKSILLTPIKDSLEGHLLVFAAEESRKNEKIIRLREFENSIREQI